MLARNKTSWFRQLTIWIMVFIIAISFVPKAQASTTKQYEQLTGETKFIEIKKQVTHSAQKIYKCRASEIHRELVKASRDFNKISDMVQKSDNVDDVIDKVANKLDKIATAYKKASNYDLDIYSVRKVEFDNLKLLKDDTLKAEKELRQKIAIIRTRNSYINRRFGDISDKIERQKLEIRLQGNQSIINSLNTQRIIWKRFYQKQEKMFDVLNLNAQKIDLLLYILSVNSKVYHAAADVTRLRRSPKSTLENLEFLADLQDVIIDLKDSGLEVNHIVSEISQAEFTIDIK